MNIDGINDRIIIKSLNLLIDIFNIQIDKEIIDEKLIDLENDISKSFIYHGNIEKIDENKNKTKKNNLEEKINQLEKLLIKNTGILSYLIEN